MLSNSALVSEKKNTWKSYTVLAPVFAHPLISCIRFLHIKCKIIGKAKMETTTMWLLTIIIIKDIKCFQICAYFEGLGTNFLYSFWEPSKVCMRDITERCNIYHKLRVGLLTLHFHWNVKNCSGIWIMTIKIILQSIWGRFKLIQ